MKSFNQLAVYRVINYMGASLQHINQLVVYYKNREHIDNKQNAQLV